MLIRAYKHFDIYNNNYSTKHEITVYCQSSNHTVPFKSIIKSVKSDCCEEDTLPYSINEPSPEYPFVKKYIIEADSIHFWTCKEYFFFVLPVENCKPHNWYTSENNVVHLIQPHIVNDGCTEITYKSKYPYWYDVKHIFIKHVCNQIRVTPIRLSAMYEKQVL